MVTSIQVIFSLPEHMPIHDQVWLHNWGCELTSGIVWGKRVTVS